MKENTKKKEDNNKKWIRSLIFLINYFYVWGVLWALDD